jgi:hypothetical protein
MTTGHLEDRAVTASKIVIVVSHSDMNMVLLPGWTCYVFGSGDGVDDNGRKEEGAARSSMFLSL